MKLSQREATLFVATAYVTLFGVTAVIVAPRIEEIRSLSARRAEVRAQIEVDRELIANREEWRSRAEELRNRLPNVPPDKRMDVHWLSVMDRLAARHGVRIARRQAGEERQHGDIYELPIQCEEWESDLSSLLHFLFDLQSEGAMMSIRELHIRPRDRRMLRGRFALYCAYTKSSDAKSQLEE